MKNNIYEEMEEENIEININKMQRKFEFIFAIIVILFILSMVFIGSKELKKEHVNKAVNLDRYTEIIKIKNLLKDDPSVQKIINFAMKDGIITNKEYKEIKNLTKKPEEFN